MVREWRVFPYGRNIAVVVSALMDKDRQGAAQKCQAVVRLHEARPKRQRGAAKAAAPGGGKPPLAAKSAVPGFPPSLFCSVLFHDIHIGLSDFESGSGDHNFKISVSPQYR